MRLAGLQVCFRLAQESWTGWRLLPCVLDRHRDLACFGLTVFRVQPCDQLEGPDQEAGERGPLTTEILLRLTRTRKLLKTILRSGGPHQISPAHARREALHRFLNQ